MLSSSSSEDVFEISQYPMAMLVYVYCYQIYLTMGKSKLQRQRQTSEMTLKEGL